MALVVVGTEHYEENASFNLNDSENDYLRSHISDYDTRLFVFKSNRILWHRVSLLSNNTESIINNKLRTLLLVDVCWQVMDLKIGFQYLQKQGGEYSFFEEKYAFERVIQSHLGDGTKFMKWLKDEFGDEDKIFNLINPKHRSRKHLSDIVVACAIIIELTPAKSKFPQDSFFVFAPLSLSLARPMYGEPADEGILEDEDEEVKRTNANLNLGGRSGGVQLYFP